MIAFGPVPSRRLGRSLGINNIPAKVCSYSCIYCQLGRTIELTSKRKAFYTPEEVFKEVEKRFREVKARGERVDYLTFVPDGEPTLDENLGVQIDLLQELGVPIAILTNSSLLWREDVREELLNLDLVSLKVDAISERVWRRINRPERSLRLENILDGILEFSKEFKGKLIVETMLVEGINYNGEFEEISKFLSKIKPDKAYVAIPTRPPAESWVKPAREETINRAFQEFSKRLGDERVEYLIGYEGDSFTSTGDLEKDLLSITSVHPMREEGVEKLIEKTNADWKVVEKLLAEERLIKLEYEGHIYYMRKLPSRAKK